MQHHDSIKKRADKILDECCREYKSYLFKYAYFRTENDKDAAEDCVQEALIVFYKRLLKGEEFEHPKAFLYRTVDNFVKEYLKEKSKAIKQQVPLYSDEAVQLSSYEQQLENVDDKTEKEIINSLIESLSDNDKDIYISRYIDALSVKDIAEKYSISISAVTTRLLRLRQKVYDGLRKELKERGLSDE